VIIVILIVAGLVIFFAWPEKEEVPGEVTVPEVTPKEITPEIPTDWQTYQNEEYGFKVSYLTGERWPSEIVSGPIPNLFVFGPDGLNDEMIWLEITDLPLEIYYPKEATRRQIFLANQEATRYEWESEISSLRGVEGPSQYKNIVVGPIEHKGKFYVWSLNHSVKDSEVFEVFDQIITTFELID
jgi:hypothetical protein